MLSKNNKNSTYAVAVSGGPDSMALAFLLFILAQETKSKVSEELKSVETLRVSLDNKEDLDKALKDIDALVIATGARPSLDLTGPAKVDALGVFRQLESCKRVGIKRVILVSSLCTGKLFHPLNLFGLILIGTAV